VIVYGVDPEKERQVTGIYSKIVQNGGKYLDSQSPGDILISDKTAEILKLKQYIVTDSIIEKLRGEKVPVAVLEKIEAFKDIRFRSPKDFS